SQSRKSPGGGPPALLTRMSGCGHAARAALRPSLVVMSDATHATLRPAIAPISSAVRFTAPSVRATIVTSTPARASASAQPRPNPLLAAQTSARRPAMPRSMASPVWTGSLRGDDRAPHANNRADREHQQRGHHVEHLAAQRVIEHEAEPDGPHHRAEIEARVHESMA